MFRHIPWEMVADPLRPADHTLGTTNLMQSKWNTGERQSVLKRQLT